MAMGFPMFLIYFTISAIISRTMQNLYCDFGLRDDDSCPIDGGWTSWSSWGRCTGKCGFRGKRARHRTCNNPSPLNDGAPCLGPSNQIENCQIIGCMMIDYEKVVNNHPIRKEEMKIVKDFHKKLPALIELCFFVDCTFSTVEKILGDRAMLYWNAMNCIKYDVGCPKPGGWSTWEAWSPCTAVCGRGQKYRTRMCNSPVPSNTELMCNDSAFETKSCKAFNCKKHSVGTWYNWSAWSACSVECGNGIQIRKRSCRELQNVQGSSCKGPTKEAKGCSISKCSINGMWSSWTIWTPCSSSCGVGKQIRNRMCNNPSPSGNGTSCSGSASEVRQCFSKPCLVRSHEVVHFTEKSSLLYNPNGRSSRLLHMYLRFSPLSPFGVIIHRFETDCTEPTCNFVKLFLRNGRIVLRSQISGCALSLIHENKLEIGQWHVVLVAIYCTRGMIRVNDGPHKVATFSCTPLMHNLDQTMKIGGFQGQIQQVAINFASIQLRVLKDEYNRRLANTPFSSNNVEYLMGNNEEGFIHVGLTDSVIAPSPKSMEFWQITLVIKTEDTNGIIAMIPGNSLSNCILLLLDEGRVKLQLYYGVNHVAIESTEHIVIGEWFETVVVQDGKSLYMQINGNEKKYVPVMSDKTIITSATNIFLGAILDETKEKLCPNCVEISQMSFTLGHLNIDGHEIDLLSLPVLETTSKHFSSRTISISDYYEEVPLLLGQELKLSCFYNKIPHEKKYDSSKGTYATWLLMDKLLQSYDKSDDLFHLKDDGRVSTISIASYTTREVVENFYSCYIYHYKNKSNKGSSRSLFSFGVTAIDKREEFESVTWRKWRFIQETTIACFLLIIIWCLVEIFQDVKHGYGFYRLPPRLNNDSTPIINFVSSKNGITLLGSKQAADEIVSKITNDN